MIFWISTFLIGVLVLWMLYRVLLSWLRFFRQQVFYVEAVVLLMGLIFAIAVIAWIYPPR